MLRINDEKRTKSSATTAAAALVWLVGIASIATHVNAATIVAPGAQAAAEGDFNNIYPFGIETSMRYQQVYAASHFSALAGPALITQIAFRPDTTYGGGFSSTLPDIQINLSTTSANPDGLSTTFANNVGGDETVVYGRGALTLSSSFSGPAEGPKAFDIVIAFTTPFFYNPANGNLLLDVRKYGGDSTLTFDSLQSSGDGLSRGSVGDVNALAGSIDTAGLVTQFTFEPVPEPSTCIAGALMLLPFAATIVRKLRKTHTA